MKWVCDEVIHERLRIEPVIWWTLNSNIIRRGFLNEKIKREQQAFPTVSERWVTNLTAVGGGSANPVGGGARVELLDQELREMSVEIR